MKKLLFLALFSASLHAQQSVLSLPHDSRNSPLMAGLGLPYLFEPTVTVTAYSTSERSALNFSGDNTNRQYRHMMIYNPSSTLSIYLCAGDSTGCYRDMWKVRPGLGLVDDFSYFGTANNLTHIYYRLSGAGSVSPDVRVW